MEYTPKTRPTKIGMSKCVHFKLPMRRVGSDTQLPSPVQSIRQPATDTCSCKVEPRAPLIEPDQTLKTVTIPTAYFQSKTIFLITSVISVSLRHHFRHLSSGSGPHFNDLHVSSDRFSSDSGSDDAMKPDAACRNVGSGVVP